MQDYKYKVGNNETKIFFVGFYFIIKWHVVASDIHAP